MPSWALFLLVLTLAVIFSYVFIFLVGYKIRRAINKQIERNFRKLKGISLIKNDNGIYDIKGSFNGRKIEIRHLTDIWKKPKKMLFKVKHNIPTISKNVRFMGYTVTPKFIKREFNEWPSNTLIYLKNLIKILIKIESQPNLIYSKDKEVLFELFLL